MKVRSDRRNHVLDSKIVDWYPYSGMSNSASSDKPMRANPNDRSLMLNLGRGRTGFAEAKTIEQPSDVRPGLLEQRT